MAIAFDAASEGYASGTSLTVSHTVTGSAPLLIACVGTNGTNDTVTGVTYNGVAMTQLGTVENTYNRLYIYGLLAPATGTHDIVVSNSASVGIRLRAASYSGAKQSGLPDAVATWSTASGTSTTMTVTTTVADCWLVAMARNGYDNYTIGANTVKRSPSADGETVLLDSNGPRSTGSNSLNATYAGAANSASVTISIAPLISTTVNADRSAELTGEASSNANRSAELSGIASTNANRSAELTGQDYANAARSAELSGEATDTANRSAELHGEATDAASRSAETHGQADADDNRSAEVMGEASDASARNADLHGEFTTTHVRTIRFDHTKVASDITNYPAYVDLSDLDDAFWDSVAEGGGDIRCFASDGTTELPREVVSCVTATKIGELWVKIPTLSSSADTVVHIRYGTGNPDYSPTDTYGKYAVWESDAKLVAHLEGLTDSTVNQNDASATTASLIDAKIQKGYSMAGDFLNFPDISAIDGATALTVRAWVKSDSYGTGQGLVVKWDYATQGCFGLETGALRRKKIALYIATSLDDTGIGCRVDSTNDVLVDGQWSRIAFVFDGTRTGDSNRLKFYVNGQPIAMTQFAGNVPASLTAGGTATLKVGKFGGSLDRYFYGMVDEVDISTRALTADEIATDYANQNDPSGFYSVDHDWINAELTGQDSSNAMREAELSGEASLAEARDAELHGEASDEVSRSAELFGVEFADDARSAELSGIADTDANRSCETTGELDADADRSAEVYGEGVSADYRSAELHGQADTNAYRQAETTGEATDTDNRDAELHGEADADVSRLAELSGEDTADGSRNAETSGICFSSSFRGCEMFGGSKSAAVRPVYLTTKESKVIIND
jgi:hypothetical protein